MQGQANHFSRYAPERIEYGVQRYTNETRRLYSVLNTQLEKSTSGYLVGDRCTIADIAHWGWIARYVAILKLCEELLIIISAGWAGVDIDEYPALKVWEERMMARPGVEKGRHVPSPHTIKETLKNAEEVKKTAEEGRKWVQQGMADSAKK
jgi:glutathione S-transferase